MQKLLSLFSYKAYAQITNPAIGALGEEEGASSGETFVNYFIDIWNAIIVFGGIAVIVMYIWAAIDWITAGGDSGKLEKARTKMLQATLGIIILVATSTLIGFISFLFFGDAFNLLQLNLPTPGGTDA